MGLFSSVVIALRKTILFSLCLIIVIGFIFGPIAYIVSNYDPNLWPVLSVIGWLVVSIVFIVCMIEEL